MRIRSSESSKDHCTVDEIGCCADLSGNLFSAGGRFIMFIGHFAVALGAKKVAPEVSLGTLIMAAQLADLLWPTLVLLGVEKVEIRPGTTAFTPLDFVYFPWSHSLDSLIGWALAMGVAYKLVTRRQTSAAITVAALVVSHWVLDVITHRPDMPLTMEGAERLGLGLWNSIPGTIVVEVLMFALGVYLYWKTTQALDRTGTIAFWSLVAFLSAIYVANIVGPPPPSVAALAWVGESIWLLVAWGYWIDRHRTVRQQQT